jgi:membrane protein DedA with SNARE-associated domain
MTQLLLHWIVLYGYPGIFAALLLGIFGAPIPDEVILPGRHVSTEILHLFVLCLCRRIFLDSHEWR